MEEKSAKLKAKLKAKLRAKLNAKLKAKLPEKGEERRPFHWRLTALSVQVLAQMRSFVIEGVQGLGTRGREGDRDRGREGA